MKTVRPQWQLDLIALFGRLAAIYETADTTTQAELQRRMRPTLRRIKHRTPAAKLNADIRTQLLADMDEAKATMDDIVGKDWQPEHGSLGAKLKGIGLI